MYCGSFQPLNGIEMILDTYKNKSFDFSLTLIGGRNQQELSYAKNLIGEKNIRNIKLKGWVFYEDLEKNFKELKDDHEKLLKSKQKI